MITRTNYLKARHLTSDDGLFLFESPSKFGSFYAWYEDAWRLMDSFGESDLRKAWVNRDCLEVTMRVLRDNERCMDGKSFVHKLFFHPDDPHRPWRHCGGWIVTKDINGVNVDPFSAYFPDLLVGDVLRDKQTKQQALFLGQRFDPRNGVCWRLLGNLNKTPEDIYRQGYPLRHYDVVRVKGHEYADGDTGVECLREAARKKLANAIASSEKCLGNPLLLKVAAQDNWALIHNNKENTDACRSFAYVKILSFLKDIAHFKKAYPNVFHKFSPFLESIEKRGNQVDLQTLGGHFGNIKAKVSEVCPDVTLFEINKIFTKLLSLNEPDAGEIMDTIDFDNTLRNLVRHVRKESIIEWKDRLETRAIRFVYDEKTECFMKEGPARADNLLQLANANAKIHFTRHEVNAVIRAMGLELAAFHESRMMSQAAVAKPPARARKPAQVMESMTEQTQGRGK